VKKYLELLNPKPVNKIKWYNVFYKLLLSLFLTGVFADNITKSELTLNTIQHKNIEYLAINKFITSHQLKSTYYESKEKLEIIFENKKLYLSPFSSYCKINDISYHLTYEVILKNNQLYVPVLPFYNILEHVNLPVQFLGSKNNKMKVLTNIYNIKEFYINNKTNGAALIIKTTKKFNESDIATSINSSGWLNITILNCAIDSVGIQNSILNHPIIQVNTVQHKTSSQISFLLNKKVDDIIVSTHETTIEVLLAIEQASNVKKIQELRKKWLIDTIVLDPGHGGKDPGAIGIKNLQEKTITLDITKQLGNMIERNLGMKVIYTREEDVFVPLWKRTQIANNAEGDIFISIHANSSKKHSSIKGFETYLLRIGKTEAAVEAAKRENETIKLEEQSHKYIDFSDAKRIVASMTQNSAMKSSEFLAEAIQRNLSKHLNSKDRGVKQAGFHVLVGATMPNVLIEVGFITNKEEATLLNKAQYKRSIAKGIFEAILDFKNKYERK